MWQSGRVPFWEDDEPRTRSAQALAPDRVEDVALARRGAPTFGARPGDPSPLQSLRDFTRRYGWRAYALPGLVVITVLALMTAGGENKPAAGSHPGPGAANAPGPPTASSDIALKSDEPGPHSGPDPAIRARCSRYATSPGATAGARTRCRGSS